MNESRCGLLCSECGYREEMNCGGCLSGNPFWGKCPVKGCCEARDNGHCGECMDFPCKLLHSYAYDGEQGDHGARIGQCVAWKGEAE